VCTFFSGQHQSKIEIAAVYVTVCPVIHCAQTKFCGVQRDDLHHEAQDRMYAVIQCMPKPN
jgi:hypothetical protein